MKVRHDPINLEVRPEHLKRAAERSSKSRARDRVLDGPTLPRKRPRASDGVLEPSADAVEFLLRLFGYPTSAPAVGHGWTHRITDPREEQADQEPARHRAPRRPEREVRRQARDGSWERSCCTCRRWKKEDAYNFRWRTYGGRAAQWTSECLVCQHKRRADFYRARGR